MTFEEMTFGEKIDHIWEYYKFHIMAGLGVVLLIGSLLNIYLFNPAPDVVLDISVRVPQFDYDTEYGSQLQANLVDAVIDYPESQTVTVELLQTDASDPQMVMAVEAKFMGKAESEEIDLIVADEETFRYFLSEGYFLDIGQLESRYGITLPEEAKIYSTDPATQQKLFMSMDVRKLPGLAPILTTDEGNYYVGVFVRSISEERVMRALEYLSQ